MATVTANATLKDVLDEANPNQLADAMQQMKLGTMMTVLEESITISSGTVIDLTADSVAGKAALMVLGVDVTAGTATGVRMPAPSTSTPTTTAVAVAADGTTLTFEAAITVATVRWLPVPDTAMTADFPKTGLG